MATGTRSWVNSEKHGVCIALWERIRSDSRGWAESQDAESHMMVPVLFETRFSICIQMGLQAIEVPGCWM